MKRSVLVAAATAACLMPAAAHAEFGAPSILTLGVQAQAGGGSPAVSGDGRYVVFSSSPSLFKDEATAAAKGLIGKGLVRQAVDTGELDVVMPGGETPSVSGDGRYVAFTTTAPLVATDTNGVADVYRRDMGLSLDSPGAIELISRGTDRDEPLSYGPIQSGAALAPGAQALSADGNRVIFSITATSNVLAPNSPNLATARGAIVVRDVAAGTSNAMNVDQFGNIENFETDSRAASSAPSLTSDGEIALWKVSSINRYFGRFNQLEDHLVQRRIDAPRSAIRVVFGPADPEDPACGPKDLTTTKVAPGPCDGLAYGNGAISGWAANADGSKVAVSGLSRAVAIPSGTEADLFLVDMTRTGSRKEATRRLTAGATLQTGSTTGIPLAMSADGRRIVFTAANWAPNITPPIPVGAFLNATATSQPQPYLVDLNTDTLRLLAAGYDATPFDRRIQSVSMSGDGTTVAMDTDATNLFYGDTNGGLDTFLLRDLPPLNRSPLTAAAPPVVAAADPQPNPRLEVVVNPTTAGGITARVAAPWNGKLTIDVRRRASVVLSAKRKPPAQPRVLDPVAADLMGLGTRSFLLSPRRRYLADLRRERGIPALVTVTLAVAGKPTLTRSIPVTLRRAIVKAKKGQR